MNSLLRASRCREVFHQNLLPCSLCLRSVCNMCISSFASALINIARCYEISVEYFPILIAELREGLADFLLFNL